MESRQMQSAPHIFAVSFFSIVMVSATGFAKDSVDQTGVSSGRMTPRDPALGVAQTRPSDQAFVQDEAGEKSDARLETYLALHCQAVARLPLGEPRRPYMNPACPEISDVRSSW